MKRPPSLCRNKAKDFAYVYINRKQVYLGKWGSAEAQAVYKRLILEWVNQNGRPSIGFPREKSSFPNCLGRGAGNRLKTRHSKTKRGQEFLSLLPFPFCWNPQNCFSVCLC